MKSIQILVALIFFLLSAVLTLSVSTAGAQTVPEAVKDAVGITAEETKDTSVPIKTDSLDSKALQELSDSTRMTLDEKKKGVSDSVVETR